MPRDASGQVIPGSYGQQPTQENDGGGEAGIRQAIAQRFPDVLPDKLDEVFQAWQEHSHWAQREGQEADLEQFFQQYEAAPQESQFGGREVNQELPPELLQRMQQGQQPQQEMMQEMPTSLMQQGRQNPMDWDGKIYEEMGEGQPPRVVAEGLAAPKRKKTLRHEYLDMPLRSYP